jgi:hypothetical protein
MMGQQATVGQQVHLTTRDYEPDYRPGDRGTVLSGPHPTPSGGFFYLVRLEKDGPAAAEIILHAEELELQQSESVSS